MSVGFDINQLDYIHQLLQSKAFYSNGNNFIFELTAAKAEVIYGVDPIYTDNTGFGDVSAIAYIVVDPSMFDKFFFFQVDPSNSLFFSKDNSNNFTIPSPHNIVKYGVNTDYMFDVSLSNTTVVAGNIEGFGPQQLKYDYIRYLAYAITSGVSNGGIFANEATLVQGVSNLDRQLCQTLNNGIQTNPATNIYTDEGVTSHIYLDDDTHSYPYSTKQLINGLLNIASPQRKRMFVNDMEKQYLLHGDRNSFYWVPFHDGDALSILIKYVPKNGSGNPIIPNTGPVYTRSYKIVFYCSTQAVIVPPTIITVGYNPRGNVDPNYVINLMSHITTLDVFSSIDISNISTITEFNVNNFIQVYNAVNIVKATLLSTDISDSLLSAFVYLYQNIGRNLQSPLDYYYRTHSANMTQPTIISNDILQNNGVNPSFQYIFLNCNTNNIFLPNFQSIRRSLLVSPMAYYPTIGDIKDITCKLNVGLSSFKFRIYTRPYITSIDNTNNITDQFYGTYYESINLFGGDYEYISYDLTDLFPLFKSQINEQINVPVMYYNSTTDVTIDPPVTNITSRKDEQILYISISTDVVDINLGISDINITYN